MLLEEFDSIAACAKHLGTRPQYVHNACAGQQHTVLGYKARYKEQWRKRAAAPGPTRVTLKAGATKRGVKVPVELLDDSGTVQYRFNSEMACARHFNASQTGVRQNMLGVKGRFKGYTVRHANEPQRPRTPCAQAKKRAQARAKVVILLPPMFNVISSMTGAF